MLKIHDFLPRVRRGIHQVLLYKDYHFIEQFPSSVNFCHVPLFSHQCSLLGVSLPDNCNFAYFGFSGFSITLKEIGPYQLIIIKYKIPYEQNSKT